MQSHWAVSLSSIAKYRKNGQHDVFLTDSAPVTQVAATLSIGSVDAITQHHQLTGINSCRNAANSRLKHVPIHNTSCEQSYDHVA